jgi:hypothetical protein
MSRKLIKAVRIAAVTLFVCATCVASASASASGVKLQLLNTVPDTVRAGEEMTLRFFVQNTGGKPTQGPIDVVDAFGNAVTNVKVGSQIENLTGETSAAPEGASITTSCQEGTTALSCAIEGSLQPGVQVFIELTATVSPLANGGIPDTVTVSGGGMAGTTQEESTIAIASPGAFGFDTAGIELPNADGSEDVLAASVPAEFTTKLRWKSFYSALNVVEKSVDNDEYIKDVVAHLPAGFIGNPSATVLCKTDELSRTLPVPPASQGIPRCPADSQVGVVRIQMGGVIQTTGLFNMVPPYGASAELGFDVLGTVIQLRAYVRPGDHGLDIVSPDTSTTLNVTGVEVTVWGVPSDPSHDIYRGTCIVGKEGDRGPGGLGCPSSATRQAFLRMPTSCSGVPLEFGAESNSYENPDVWSTANVRGPTVQGCDMVPFSPSISVTPTGTATSSPTGLSVKLSVPQSRSPEGLAEADLKKAVVTLPEGMSINPATADGLQVCSDAQLHLDSNTPAECPDGSKIGTVVLHTQLIANPVEGSVFLRPQLSQDPMSGEMFRMVMELRDDAHGLDFKIPGQIQANPQTGRLTTTFDDNPQFPFEDISLQFKSGARSALSTPATCSAQSTEAKLYSYARPEEAVERSSSFQLTSGPGGTPCPGAVLPFSPGLNAGVSDVEAGAFTSFLSTFTRSDADQHLQGVSITMPKGLLGSLVGLPLCGEAQANAGTCSSESQIGTVTAGAGTGPTPFYVTGGRVYMTTSYKGAPFGLSIVVPTVAGPYDLGNVVVRAKVEIDPHTAQLTVTTDPLPQVVGGIPVDLRLVNVTINRANFVFNPTNCAQSTVTGRITGVQGTVADVSNAFQVTNCAALKFPPQFKVTTNGKTSRAGGASLTATLTYPKMILGKFVNIAKVKVSLPKQLPSRLTTLQKACTAQTFEANPAACPVPSRIGMATASTPVLPVPLSGPVYFVSHGGQAFPDLVVVLQGYGVTIDLVGNTFISKTGITSTTFNTVPDVAVGSFQLKLPEGPYSALAANGNLCKLHLSMPTTFVGQDGQELHQTTAIATSNCAKHKTREKAVARHKHTSSKHGKK